MLHIVQLYRYINLHLCGGARMLVAGSRPMEFIEWDCLFTVYGGTYEI